MRSEKIRACWGTVCGNTSRKMTPLCQKISEELRVKSEEYKFGEFGGITLISLVITIIILIILAGIGINLSLGENGIFRKTEEAKELTNKQTATEKINLKITTVQINKYAEKQEMPTLKELSIALKEDKEIEYVTEKSQIASTKYEVGENPSSIFTKLSKYPYEFEINSSLQLASINGIKIAKNNTENEINWCNPKQLVVIDLPNSLTNKVTVGEYKANTDAFTKTNREDFDNYLSYDASKGWTILKSGYYMINCQMGISHTGANSSFPDEYVHLNIDNTTNILLDTISVRLAGETDTDANNTNVYLEKGTIINFTDTIRGGSVMYHFLNLRIYALFN